MKFNSLGLSQPLLDAIAAQGYETPSPIQAQAIPPVLEGRDVMAAAQTGTGKTAGFTLPILHRLSGGHKAQANQVRALVLVPTRELAAQVAESVELYGQNLPLRSTAVFGGVKINPQMMKLRRGVDVLVATPGRLLDLYQQNAISFKTLEMLVLDEADRMLDMGFIHDLRRITSLLPKERQNLMFSATFSDEIRDLAKAFTKNPVEISVSPRNSTAKSVEQYIYPVDKNQKATLLTTLIKERNWWQVLVFTRTKHGANKLTRHLESKGLKAAAIHGNKSQGARTRALAEFKSGDIGILVATDIAARGLDIDQLPQVVNFDLPHVAEDYVHRIGRTGRAGAVGEAISLVFADEFKQLSDIERLIQNLLERKAYEGFSPVHPLPESRLNTRPPRNKKPKKNKSVERSASGDANRPSGRAQQDKRNKPATQRKSDESTAKQGKRAGGKPSTGKPNTGASAKPQSNSGGGKRHTGSENGERHHAGKNSKPKAHRSSSVNRPEGAEQKNEPRVARKRPVKSGGNTSQPGNGSKAWAGVSAPKRK